MVTECVSFRESNSEPRNLEDSSDPSGRSEWHGVVDCSGGDKGWSFWEINNVPKSTIMKIMKQQAVSYYIAKVKIKTANASKNW